MKPGADVIRIPKQGYQWSHKSIQNFSNTYIYLDPSKCHYNIHLVCTILQTNILSVIVQIVTNSALKYISLHIQCWIYSAFLKWLKCVLRRCLAAIIWNCTERNRDLFPSNILSLLMDFKLKEQFQNHDNLIMSSLNKSVLPLVMSNNCNGVFPTVMAFSQKGREVQWIQLIQGIW